MRTSWSTTRGWWPRPHSHKSSAWPSIDERVTLPQGAAGRANCGTKALTVIGAMLTGGDSIDDADVLRAGAGPEVFDAIRDPSTIGIGPASGPDALHTGCGRICALAQLSHRWRRRQRTCRGQRTARLKPSKDFRGIPQPVPNTPAGMNSWRRFIFLC